MNKLIIAIGSDHAGFAYKEKIKQTLIRGGYEVLDKGTFGETSVDYPDFAHPVASAVESGAANWGILICGSGNGVAITANKHAGIRAALCWKEELARLARAHNDANVLCIPARFVSLELAKKMVKAFLSEPFEGGRHLNRVQKITC
ncbi:MAG TPA: ribose 5-phosphate isomerase B [Saprospiraceae bacterium]|nr:ribose 5-phosphate isomerase B [Saprospiraceae bacterium]HRG19751.1 ribose 5-phosphate isomerase B [Saprospiraceae bacterium]